MNNFLIRGIIKASKKLLTCISNGVSKSSEQKFFSAKSVPESTLPSLSVPKLKDTLDLYLRSVEPFLSSDELSNTKNIVECFSNTDGLKLQNYLEKRAATTENWLSEWWLNTAYLEYRNPVVVWSSPGLVFPIKEFNSIADQLKYAVNVVYAALLYRNKIQNNEIATDMMKGKPLDMAQYKKIFGTCRIPDIPRDKLAYSDPDKPADHIVVAHNNNFFHVKVIDENNNLLSVEELYGNLLQIVECSLDRGPQIGILTSDNRDIWAESYNILLQDEENKSSMKIIQESIFLLCLDKYGVQPDNMNKQTFAGLQTVHGGGSTCNGANRWFDKTIQFVVNQSGVNGLTYEHSPAEGQPIAVMMDFIVDHLKDNYSDIDIASPHATRSHCVKLNFKTEKVNQRIKDSEENMNKLVDDLEMNCFTYDLYGKSFIKKQNLSPDSYIQMALQYAFYRLHKTPGAHYESASTRLFLHGRTETIRSCSSESINFAKIMLQSDRTKEEKIEALRQAVSGHKQYTQKALNGCGVDRHLLGLKLAARELGMSLPELFTDVAYARSTHMRISTSQVASKCDGFMCYGPLVDNGYACCYNPREHSMNFGTSAFRNNSETKLTFFKNALINSLEDMSRLFA